MASNVRRRVKQGVRLNSQAKEIVSNVYKYFKDLERRSKGKGAFQRTLEATGISRPTLSKVVKTEEAGSSFGTPERRYRKTRARVVTDSFDVEAIRRKIYEQYDMNKRITLNSLLNIVKRDQVFNGGRTKLAALLKEMGFKYRSIDDRRYYYEQPRIVEQRHKYLRKMMQNRVDKKPVVFLDETWANSHDGKDLAWVENDPVTKGTLGGVRCPSGKGTRLIILGAGGETGWIPNTALIFQSKKNTGDYHDEMTGEHFEEWFRDTLLPNLRPNSLIVMDNASYHSRLDDPVPTKSWTKKKMIEWLVNHNITFPTQALKSEIWSVIQKLNLCPQYIVDKMAHASGHEVVRLPVAHCALNPIELAWAQVKDHIKANNTQFNLKEVERLAWEGFEVVTSDRWKNLVKHVQDKFEDHYWEVDRIAEYYSIREFVIHVGGESDDEYDNSDDEVLLSDQDSDDDLAALDKSDYMY